MGNILLPVMILNGYMIRSLLLFFQGCGAIKPDHKEVYQQWGKVKGTPIQVTDQSGEKKVVRKPTFSENLRFMFSYQFGYMYFRYFMWNFSGKQNDTQGTRRCHKRELDDGDQFS